MQKTEEKHRPWLLAALFAALVAVANPVFASNRRIDSDILLGGTLGAAAGIARASADPCSSTGNMSTAIMDDDHDRHYRSQAKHH